MIKSIKALKTGKTSGADGLQSEFYKCFCNILAPILLKVYDKALPEQKLHFSARWGIITLIEKIGKDPLFLSNWKPLSLLNTNYKILAKLLAIRLNTALPKLIHPMQSSFMKGRQISDLLI